MRPFTRSIIELFDGKRRYLIPLYQRQYAWKVKPQLELLWHDIERVANRLEAGGAQTVPHFMGAMVISHIDTFGRQVQAFEVIDGQQRLTTFQLLLAALRDVANEDSPDYVAEAMTYLKNDGIMAIPEVETYKLWPSLIDRSAFTKIVDPEGVGAPTKHVVVESDEVIRPAAAAYEYFKARIRNHVYPDGLFDPFRLEKLFEALKTGLAAVSIELEGGDDPQTIFETLNSRGVDLTASDLMRNFIFQRAVGGGQEQGSLKVDDLYEKYWLPLDRWFWREGDTRGRQTKPRLDWMLVDHLAMQTAALVSVETLFEVYRRWILDIAPFPNIDSELSAISASAVTYRRVAEQNKDDPLGQFGRFARAYDVSTAMPLVLYLDNESGIGAQLHEALHLIESYIVRRDICGLSTGNYNRFFVELVGKLRIATGNKIDTLAALLANGKIDIARWPDDVEFSRAWLARAQYKASRQPRLRFLFDAIEAKKRKNMDEVVEIKTDLTIEHIMPMKWREHWPLPADVEANEFDILMSESERDTKIHTLGNLTLLTQQLNSTVSNGPFSVKLPAVKAQSALVLNRELQAFDKWDEETIALRSTHLFKTASAIWLGPGVSAN